MASGVFQKSLIIAYLFLFAPSIPAQEEEDSVKSIDDFYIDFAVSDLTPFTLLGITPNAVSRPGTPKELAADILNIVSGGKNITPGVGVEWSPYRTFENKENRTILNYRKYRHIRNMQISFGSVQDTGGSKISAGLKWVFIDNTDLLLNEYYRKEMVEALKEYDSLPLSPSGRLEFQKLMKQIYIEIDSAFFQNEIFLDDEFYNMLPTIDLPAEPPDAEVKTNELIAKFASKGKTLNASERIKIEKLVIEYMSLVEKDRAPRRKILEGNIKDVRSKYKKENWNGSVGQIGVGTIFNSPDFSWKGLRNERISFFGGYSFPIYDFGQGIVHAQYNAFYSDSSDEKNNLMLGARLLLGSSDFRASVEALYNKTNKNKNLPNEELLRSTLGLELKMSQGLWFEIAFGIDSSVNELKKSSIISLANIKYAFQREPRFKFGD